MSEPIDRPCKACGKPVIPPRRNGRDRVCCSQACATGLWVKAGNAATKAKEWVRSPVCTVCGAERSTTHFREPRSQCRRCELDAVAKRHKQRMATDPEYAAKVRARDAVRNAVRHKSLNKNPCAICGSRERVHGHHEDYSRPLDVTWLCRDHHREAHRLGDQNV